MEPDPASTRRAAVLEQIEALEQRVAQLSRVDDVVVGHPGGHAPRPGPLALLGARTGIWCLGCLLLPGPPSVLLGLFGLRQYLLWWIAPLS